MAHIEYLKSVSKLQGKTVVDVGSGDGTYSRHLDEAGAIVTAVEIDPIKVSKAKTELPSSIRTILGRAENLPIEDYTQELVCFFFSLHHVPVNAQNAAFDEVLRILKPDGRLHVVEPFPYGSMFEVVRMVEDETFVRTNSQKVLNELGQTGRFRLLAKTEYVLTREYPNFESFLDAIVRHDPDRSAKFEEIAEEMEETFYENLEEVDGIQLLRQPCAAFHFEIKN